MYVYHSMFHYDPTSYVFHLKNQSSLSIVLTHERGHFELRVLQVVFILKGTLNCRILLYIHVLAHPTLGDDFTTCRIIKYYFLAVYSRRYSTPNLKIGATGKLTCGPCIRYFQANWQVASISLDCTVLRLYTYYHHAKTQTYV